MFGSEIAARVIYEQLTGLSAVTAAVGTRVHGLITAPKAYDAPFCLFHPEMSRYTDARIGVDAIDFEELRFQVRFITRGEDAGPIRPAAIAQLRHFLTMGPLDLTDGGEPYQIVFTPQGEVPLTTLVDGGVVFRQLGTVYTVELSRGG